MADWIADNKAWLFDGSIVGLLAIAATLFVARRNRGEGSAAKSIRQKQRGGRGSTNTQIGSIHVDQPLAPNRETDE